jgi:excisionase family DNA binding protein
VTERARRARRSSGDDTEDRHPERFGGPDRRQRFQFFTIAETAEMLGLSTRTIRRLITAGELVAHRFGHAVRIAEPDLRAFLALHREG